MANVHKLPPLTFNASLRWDVLARMFPDQPGSVLEIGCGRGAVSARIAQRASHLLAIEPDPVSYRVAKANLSNVATVLNATSSELPSSSTFDTVCAFEVLEHIEDDVGALGDWRDLLKPGGEIFLSVPAWQHRMGEADQLVGHFRRYSPAELRCKLEDAGFSFIESRLYGYPFGYMLEFGRNAFARRKLSRSGTHDDFAARTSKSGRLLQPDNGLLGSAIGMLSVPMRWSQQLFPNRGPGLIARASSNI